MSVILENIAKVSMAHTNLSPSKMRYSFPKAQRFKEKIKQSYSSISSDSLYLHRSTLSKHQVPFTKAKKNIPIIENGPSPNKYDVINLSTSFVKDKAHRSYTFGVSRNAYAKVSGIPWPLIDKSLPGPGKYESTSVIGSSSKYTIRNKSVICNIVI